jgi:oligopeptidase B
VLCSCARVQLDVEGNEKWKLLVKDLSTGKLLPDVILNTSHVDWSTSDVLYYSRLDTANRPYQLYRHRLGADVGKDELLFEEPDEMYWMGFYRSISGDCTIHTPPARLTRCSARRLC